MSCAWTWSRCLEAAEAEAGLLGSRRNVWLVPTGLSTKAVPMRPPVLAQQLVSPPIRDKDTVTSTACVSLYPSYCYLARRRRRSAQPQRPLVAI